MERKNVEGVVDKPMISAVLLVKAELGRDIFAGEAVREIKRGTLVVDRRQAPEESEKKISSVVAPGACNYCSLEWSRMKR